MEDLQVFHYHDRTLEVANMKYAWAMEEEEVLDKDMPDLAEKEIDVATLPLAESSTVLTENGRKRVIIMGDPVVQYLNREKPLRRSIWKRVH